MEPKGGKGKGADRRRHEGRFEDEAGGAGGAGGSRRQQATRARARSAVGAYSERKPGTST